MDPTQRLFDLKGKSAIVTGAARGIGRAIALRLADAGASVALCDLKQDGVDPVAAEIAAAGGRAWALAADVSDNTAIERFVAEAARALGGVDILVNNAALRGWSTWDTLTQDEWDRFMAVNTRGVFFMSQAVGKHMSPGSAGDPLSTSPPPPLPCRCAGKSTTTRPRPGSR
jgi:NAD(P)-dependent dehydrogenase (short-subunit alcohol dehydrogenase family)